MHKTAQSALSSGFMATYVFKISRFLARHRTALSALSSGFMIKNVFKKLGFGTWGLYGMAWAFESRAVKHGSEGGV
jgi:hypothetical protein